MDGCDVDGLVVREGWGEVVGERELFFVWCESCSFVTVMI